MSDAERRQPGKTPSEQPPDTSDTEHDRIRSSNDRDQALEREGTSTAHNRGYDEAVQHRDVDPDSAESQVDRDDMISDG